MFNVALVAACGVRDGGGDDDDDVDDEEEWSRRPESKRAGLFVEAAASKATCAQLFLARLF